MFLLEEPARQWPERQGSTLQTQRGMSFRENQENAEETKDAGRAYWVPGCLLGTFSCDLPRGPCADIISIIQTGKLPMLCLHPEPVCAEA